MQVKGWNRLMIVLSIGWSIFIGLSAYSQYPKALKDQSAYWHPYKNYFDAFDDPAIPKKSSTSGLFDDLIPPSRVDPNWQAFLIRGALPIALLWALYGSTIWVWRGFKSSSEA